MCDLQSLKYLLSGLLQEKIVDPNLKHARASAPEISSCSNAKCFHSNSEIEGNAKY